MKLTKKVLALCLSLLLVLPMSLPALAEDEVQEPGQSGEVQGPTDDEILAASRDALQVAVNRGISGAAYETASTADFDAALQEAKALLEQEEPAVTAEQFDAALAKMNTAKEKLVYKEGIVGGFAANNQAADANSGTSPWSEIQMNWTTADKTPIDLSKSDLSKVSVDFDLTLTNTSNDAVADSEVYGTVNIVLRSLDEEGKEHSAQYTARDFTTQTKHVNVPLTSFSDNGVDWSNLSGMRFFIPGAADKDTEDAGWFSVKLENIVIKDETPDDYQPIEGVVATFYDGKVNSYAGNDAKDLPAEWVSTTPVDLSGKPLDQMYLVVNYTLTNTTGQADDVIFNAGYFRLRSTDDEGSTPPDGENNVGYSIADLVDRGIIEQPETGENEVKIPLSESNTVKGTMKWNEVNRFRMYFDNLPAGLEAGSVTLTVNYAMIVDETEEVDPTVVGKFSKAEGTYTAVNDGAGSNVVLQTNGWVTADAAMDLSGVDKDETVLRIVMTLGNTTGTPDAEVFRTGKILLASPSTETGEQNEDGTAKMQENSAAIMIANVIDVLKQELTSDKELTLEIPLSSLTEVVGEIAWSNVNQFRIYIDSVNKFEGTTTMAIASVEVIDPSRTEPDPGPTLPDVGNVDDSKDEDGNPTITANDALMALQISTDKIEATAEQFAQADVDKNGDVSANDALQILQYATQKITEFTPAEKA